MSRSGAVFTVAAITSIALTLRAQPQTPPPQTASPPGATLQPPEAPSQQPVFRAGADVIRLDVSVLDKDRKPLSGLTTADFIVLEDGKPQRVVAVSEIDAVKNDPEPTAWMRHVAPDVAYNDLADRLGDGRLFAIVLDDFNVPWDDPDMVRTTRGVARDVIGRLGPSDVAAVVFPRDGGRTEEFTTDHDKLLEAVDRFEPREPDVPSTFVRLPPSSGDMQRSSTIMGNSQCSQSQMIVPMFEALLGDLATVPNRRKTVVFISTGAPIDFGATRGCPGELKDRMLDSFGRAARANVNVYSIDPAGYAGYERYLANPIRRGRPAEQTAPENVARAQARLRHDFMEIMADYTGASATVNSDEVETGIDKIFAEASSYYLLGYQTANGAPDGKYRKVEVKVSRPGAIARTRSGYFAAKGAGGTRDAKDQPTTNDLGFVGLSRGTALPLRAMAVPVGLSGRGAEANVAVVLTVQLPVPRASIAETVTIIRNLYDASGNPGPPIVDKIDLQLEPSTDGDVLRYDLAWRMPLPPGRYQLRLNATSKATQTSGSIFPDIEVPDFTRASLSLSGLVLGRPPAGPRTDPLANVLPMVPTTARDFGPGDGVLAFVRVLQGGTGAIAPVSVNVQVLDVDDKKKVDTDVSIPADAFSKARSADYQFALPLKDLDHGPHLVSVTARLPGGPPVRRDLLFHMR